MKKQTAVEWLINHWKKLQSENEKMSWNQIIQITELTKAMEKEQHFESYKLGNSFLDDDRLDFKDYFKQYYNETYNK